MRYSKELLIKLLVYTIMVFCSFLLVIYASSAYRNMIDENNNSENLVVSLNYLKTKVKMSENIEVINYKGVDCLVVIYDKYKNYIYYDNNQLKEVYVINDYEFDLNDGEVIMTLDDYDLEEIGGYINFTVQIDDEIRKLSVNK